MPQLRKISSHHQSAAANQERVQELRPIFRCYSVFLVAMNMPDLDTDIVVHQIPLKLECKPVRQMLRRMKSEILLKIKEEVEKQLRAEFLSTVTYLDWVANIVPVPKKDGKVRMCMDYPNLNRASPKDNFPLPHIDTLIDNTTTNVMFLFMDGFSGYNQIKMVDEDKSKTIFVTH
uniref:Reverse transcriptase domain-containing protein n=1 Tax=Fagus sylvatica TaxID=28930 RepID=A0A2N9EQG7_FAGSY